MKPLPDTSSEEDNERDGAEKEPDVLSDNDDVGDLLEFGLEPALLHVALSESPAATARPRQVCLQASGKFACRQGASAATGNDREPQFCLLNNSPKAVYRKRRPILESGQRSASD